MWVTSIAADRRRCRRRARRSRRSRAAACSCHCPTGPAGRRTRRCGRGVTHRRGRRGRRTRRGRRAPRARSRAPAPIADSSVHVRPRRQAPPSSRRASSRARIPEPAASCPCARAAARWRSGASRHPNATGSSWLRTHRARSPQRGRRRRRSGCQRYGTTVARHARTGDAPSVAAASVIAGSTERSTPTQMRTTNGTATRAWPTGTSHHDARQSTGAASNVINMPRPIVTADVPSGQHESTVDQSPVTFGGGDRQAGDAADDDGEQRRPCRVDQ